MKRVVVLVVSSLVLVLGACDEHEPKTPDGPVPLLPSDEPTKVRPDPSEIRAG
jgi:hypothetical protein